MLKHKRPTGHWIRYKINSNQSECLICSNCGSYSDPNKILDFCLTCGADMRGEENEQ